MTYPAIKKPYDRVRQIADIPSDSQTVKDAGNETDVNQIVARFSRTGELPRGNAQEAQYADVTEFQADLTEIIEKGKLAQQRMAELQEKEKSALTEKAKEDARKLAEYEKILAEKQSLSEETTTDSTES